MGVVRFSRTKLLMMMMIRMMMMIQMIE